LKIDKALQGIEKNELFSLPSCQYDRDYDDVIPMGVDIPSFCKAKHFIYRKADGIDKDLKEDGISFLKPVRFRKNTKYIMISATVDQTICEYYFGKDNIEFYECEKAKYKGRINQYHDNPYSRYVIAQDTSIFEHIKKWSGFINTITYQIYQLGPLWFGNTSGCDFMKGENIDVIGTPHQPEWIYKLFASSLHGLKFDKDAKIKPGKIVTHNGYRFRFTTYDDDVLRAIQFYMIETELEQAVGRARLLRNDCTVNLFSNFPLHQANFLELEYDKE
jgi:hypothetical protein